MECHETGKSARILYTCSGCCKDGEISDKVGRRLRAEGYAQCGSSCLAGIGAGYPRFLKAAAEASEVVSIDGCRMACAKMLLKRAQINSKSYVMTNMGFNEKCDPEEFITYVCKQVMEHS